MLHLARQGVLRRRRCRSRCCTSTPATTSPRCSTTATRPSSGSACGSSSRSVQDYIDDGRLRERADGTRNPLQTVPLLDAIDDAPVRRRLRRRPPRRGEGPRQGADLQPARRVRPVGPAQPAPRAVEPLQRPARARASTSASSRCPTGPSSTSGATSSARASSCPALYYAHEREVFHRDGMWLRRRRGGAARASDETVETQTRALPHRRRHVLHRRRRVRRRRRCDDVIVEVAASRLTERGATRADDRHRPRPPWRTARRRATSDDRPTRRAAPRPGPRRRGAARARPAPLRHRRLRRRRQVHAGRAGCCTTPSRCSPTSSTPSQRGRRRQGPGDARPGAAHRRPARRARAGHHHRRRLPLLRHADRRELHPRRLPRARAVHPQHGHRRVHRRRSPCCSSTPATASSSRPAGTSPCSRCCGVPHVVVAVNKIDLVDYDEETFTAIAADVRRPGPRARASRTTPSWRSRSRRWSATTSSTARERTALVRRARRCSSTWRRCRSSATRAARAVPDAGAVRDPAQGAGRDELPRLPRLRRPGRLGHRARRRRGRRAARRAAAPRSPAIDTADGPLDVAGARRQS